MTIQEKLKNCAGCEDDFYNHNLAANNELGCWRLKEAKLVSRKKIPLSQVPPWKQKPIEVLSCYRQKGYVFWAPDKEY